MKLTTTLKLFVAALFIAIASVGTCADNTFENIKFSQPTYSATDPFGFSTLRTLASKVPYLVSTNEMTTVLKDYVKFSDFDVVEVKEMTAKDITIDGKKPSLEGHKHSMADITNLVVEASVPAKVQTAADVALTKIDNATTIAELKAAMKEFIKSFQK